MGDLPINWVRWQLGKDLNDAEIYKTFIGILYRLKVDLGTELFEVYWGGGEIMRYDVGIYCPIEGEEKTDDKLEYADLSFFMSVRFRKYVESNVELNNGAETSRNVEISIEIGNINKETGTVDSQNIVYRGKLRDMEEVYSKIRKGIHDWTNKEYQKYVNKYKKNTLIFEKLNGPTGP